MKIYRNIETLSDYETAGEAANVIERLEATGYADDIIALAERKYPNGCTEDEFESFLTSREVVDYVGWDFIQYDSEEEYENERALSWAEITDWDDR